MFIDLADISEISESPHGMLAFWYVHKIYFIMHDPDSYQNLSPEASKMFVAIPEQPTYM